MRRNFEELVVILFLYFLKFSSSEKIRELFWISDTDGLFSHYLQTKIMLQLAKAFNRSLTLSPFSSHHFKGERLSLCDIFVLENMFCRPLQVKIATCSTVLRDDLLKSQEGFICFKGSLPLGGYVNRTDAMVRATSLENVRLQFQQKYIQHFDYYHRKLAAVNDDSLNKMTVVHWRRGDQLKTRCKREKDISVNCGDGQQLVHAIHKHSRDRTIYIATNEDQMSVQMQNLRTMGFLSLHSINSENFVSDQIGNFVFEVMLMIRATTFLGWGVSEVNDVVEYERMRLSKTFCVAKNDKPQGYLTWCESYLHSSMVPKGIKAATAASAGRDPVLATFMLD